jgi:hypothetical protein
MLDIYTDHVLDTIASRAEYYSYNPEVLPTITLDGEFELEELAHIVSLMRQGRRFHSLL